MSNSESDKICVILLGMGGPNSLDDIQPFIYNIFSDRKIIQLPGGAFFQKPFAKLISQLRYKKVQHNYSLIGGSSPLLRWTESQKEHLEFIISPIISPFDIFIGMRYFKPTIEEAVCKAAKANFNKIIFLPMYPQYCKATTGSSFSEAHRVLKKHPNIKASFIHDFHSNQAYLKLLKSYIDNNIQKGETLLFSAHSIPQKFVDDGDPYVSQVEFTAQHAAGNREYFLSYQSRTGPVKWVGPDTIDETKRLIIDGKKIFIVPISFVCDHIETLFEIDIELKELVGNSDNIRRMPMFNDDRSFGTLLANIILEHLNDSK
ncbi:MAG TPA: ferrochelatase [candidate division Zixibacteria bacterium]|nr:ferrochelatase [candidate division Zixibacteria bacterium]